MELEGRRESTNVEDRRRMGTGAKVGLTGIGGLIIAGLITLLMGGNIGDVLQQAGGMAIQNQNGEAVSPEEEELAIFASRVMASINIKNITSKKYLPIKNPTSLL